MTASSQTSRATMPIVYDLVPVNAKERTSAVFHPEIEGTSVDILVTFDGSERKHRVGPSLMALSFLLAGMDEHLSRMAREVDTLVARSQRTSAYKHDPTAPPSWCGVIGRNTWGLPIAINSFFYFARSMMDQAMDVISCTVGVQCGSSMNAAQKNSRLRKDLRKKAAEPIADLIDAAWASWGARLKDYRDLMAHHNAVPLPSIRFTEDPATGLFTGVEVFFPADAGKHAPGSRRPGQQFVSVGTYFPDTRREVGTFLSDLLLLILEVRRVAGASS